MEELTSVPAPRVDARLVPYQPSFILTRLPITLAESRYAIPMLHGGNANNMILLCNLPWGPCEVDGETYSGVVPLGMETDIASIPRELRWLYERDGRHTRAALVHDDLYATQRFSRGVCDRIFKEILESDEVERTSIFAMYHAVSAFGGEVWRKHTPESIAAARALHCYPANPFFIPTPAGYWE